MEDRKPDPEPDAALRVRLPVLLVFVVQVLTAPARAAEFETFGGWEGDGLGVRFAFIAGGIVWPRGPGVSLLGRLSASDLRYRYDVPGGETEVRSPGGEFLVGAGWTLREIRTLLLAGAEARRTESTEQVGSTRTVTTGRETGVVLQGMIDRALGRAWDLSLLANYAGANGYTYARAAVKRPGGRIMSAPFSAGFEAVGQGNRDVVSAQAGLAAELRPPRRPISVQGRLGYQASRFPAGGSASGAYTGIGFYYRWRGGY